MGARVVVRGRNGSLSSRRCGMGVLIRVEVAGLAGVPVTAAGFRWSEEQSGVWVPCFASVCACFRPELLQLPHCPPAAAAQTHTPRRPSRCHPVLGFFFFCRPRFPAHHVRPALSPPPARGHALCASFAPQPTKHSRCAHLLGRRQGKLVWPPQPGFKVPPVSPASSLPLTDSNTGGRASSRHSAYAHSTTYEPMPTLSSRCPTWPSPSPRAPSSNGQSVRSMPTARLCV